jgi:ABC-type uncharacterized transport system substrate-binding protein
MKVITRQSLTIVLAVSAIVVVSISTEAQQPGKIPVIGYLTTGYGRPPGPSAAPLTDSFRQGLRDLGYIEGKNILIEYRYAEGKSDRLLELATELVSLKVDVIVATVTPAALAAKKATRTIPIVFTGAADPVGSRLVTSLAHPGANITGLSLVPGLEMSSKQLELLKEAVPKLTHVAVLSDPGNKPTSGFLKEAERAAKSLALQVVILEARDANELNSAFSAIEKKPAGALLVIASPTLNANRTQIVSFATGRRLPAMYPYSEFVDSGGLMSYGPHQPDLWRRGATYVDKILKGTKPGDLPVEQPAKFELLINLKTAKQIGLTIPPNVLARADRVIR